MLRRGETARQVGDSVTKYSNVCRDGEKQQGRLETVLYSTEMYAETVRKSKAGWR